MAGGSAPPAGDDHPVTLSEPQLMVLIWLSLALAASVLLARLALRVAHLRKLLLDDYLLLLALALSLGLGAMHALSLPPLFALRRVLLGQQVPDALFTSQVESLLRVQFAARLLWWLNFYAVKMSLLVFLRGFLFAIPENRKWWYGALGLVLVGTVASFVGTITECSPVERNFSVEHGCSSAADLHISRLYLTTLSVWDMLTDLVIIALPLPLLRSIRRSLTTAQLVSLVLVFSTGLLMVAFSLQRVARLWQNSSVDDFPWQVTIAVTWAQVEAAVAILVGTLPAFKALWTKAMFGESSSGSGETPPGHGVVRSLNTWGHSDQPEDAFVEEKKAPATNTAAVA